MEETRMKMRKKASLVSALLASLVSSGVMADQASDIQEAKNKAEQAFEKVTALDGKVNNMVTTLDQYKDKTDALETKLKDYDTVTGNAAKAAQHDAKIAELTGKVSTAEQKVAAAEDKVDKKLEAFRTSGNIVKDIANAAKDKAEAVEGKFTTLEGKVTTVSDKADAAANKVGDLEGKVTALDGKVNNMVTTLDQYKDKTDALETKLKDYDTVTGNAAKAAQHDAKIAELTGKVAAAEQKVDTQLEAFRNVGNGVKDIANAAKDKAEAVEGKFTTLEGKVTTVSDKADAAANKVGDLEGKVTQIDDTVKSHNEEITKIKDGNRDFQEGIAGQLRQAKTETDEKVKAISGKADSAANKVGDLEAKLVDYDQVKKKANKADALDQKIDNTKTDLEATIKTVDEKVTKLANPEARIKEVEKTFGDKLARMEGYTNKGLAKVTALSGLHPLGYDAASKWNISVATGHYKSENAIAMGAFFRPNRNVLLSFAGTVSGGDDAYTFGASIRVGRSGHKEMSGASEGMISATEFYDIVGKLQDEIARQRQEIEALKNR